MSRCKGQWSIVQLTYQLLTDEQVEILTGKENAPRRDWLQASLGYLKSTRARTKVQHWFKQQAKEDNVAAGRALIEKLFKRLAVSSLDYKSISTYFGYQAVDDMYAAVGAGDITAQIVTATQHVFDEVPSKRLNCLPSNRNPTTSVMMISMFVASVIC